MNQQQDIRWKQRLQNYTRALATLRLAVDLGKQRTLSDLEQQGLIQGFEFTHELAWNVLKDYLEAQGVTDLIGSKNTTRSAFQNGLITDGETWMDMIKSRNLSSHTYNPGTAESIVEAVFTRYFSAFVEMQHRLSQLAQEQ